MEFLLAAFFVLALPIQIAMLIEWVLKKFGFFKNPLEKALKIAGYTEKQYVRSNDLFCIKVVGKELKKLHDELSDYKKYNWWKNLEMDNYLSDNHRMEKQYLAKLVSKSIEMKS